MERYSEGSYCVFSDLMKPEKVQGRVHLSRRGLQMSGCVTWQGHGAIENAEIVNSNVCACLFCLPLKTTSVWQITFPYTNTIT